MTRGAFVLASVLAIPVAATAGPVTYTGYLDDPASVTVSGGQLADYLLNSPDLTMFPDQNVALFEFTVSSASAYQLTSRGYHDVYGNIPNVDGFDAYLAVFQGTGLGATFLGEFFNPIGAGDFQTTTGLLGPGTYTLAIAMWNNYACANGACFPTTGTLGDGFSGLSNPDASRALYFEVDLDTTTAIPEPSTLTLVLSGLAWLARRRTLQRAQP
jgi:hypothetical protein